MTHVQPEEPVTIPAVAGAVDGRAGARIVALDCYDVRFPTSLEHDGSDAMNPDPDYSAAYAVLRTDAPGLEGHALCFTIGRGNEVMVAAVAALRPHVVGRHVTDIISDLGGFSAAMIGDSQLRWLGPEKGVMHMAIGAVVNAAWDLAAKVAGKPVWRLLADMTPEEIVALVDFRYLEDALTPAEALDILRGAPGRTGGAHRGARAVRATPRTRRRPAGSATPTRSSPRCPGRRSPTGSPRSSSRSAPTPPTTSGAWPSPGRRWARTSGSRSTPTSAGGSPRRRRRSPRSRPGTRTGSRSRPARTRSSAWPGSARAIAPAKIAVGEHVANRVIFKQLLQAGAADVLTIDACRVAGVNENIAILLLAAKYGVPVCPHAGGVGLCEMVQHLAMFDFVAVSATAADRVLEYVDHLHEHFTDPVRVTGGRYLAPTAPGFSATLREQSLRDYEFPHGAVWQQLAGITSPDLTQGQ